jgi:hypothetical protein
MHSAGMLVHERTRHMTKIKCEAIPAVTERRSPVHAFRASSTLARVWRSDNSYKGQRAPTRRISTCRWCGNARLRILAPC